MFPATPPRLASPPISLALVAAILLATCAWVWPLAPLMTTDVYLDFVPWYRHVVEAGPIAAFAHPFGAYSPPYLYLLAAATPLAGMVPDPVIIKLIAFAGALALVAALAQLLAALQVSQPRRRAVLALALPTVMLNAVVMAQVDALYSAPCLMVVACALRRRHRAMLGWAGLALAIKLQAVLIGPFVLGVLIARRVPLRWWLLTPAAFVAAHIPAALAGWPLRDLVLIYFNQAESSDNIARNAPNIWMWLEVSGGGARFTGLALAAAIGGCAAYAARLGWGARFLTRIDLVRWALLAPLLAAGLLPRMHERYFFLADLLAFALALAQGGRAWRIAAFVQLGSLLAYLGYFTGREWLAALGAVPMLYATWRLAQPLLARGANDNPPLMRVG